MKNILFLFGFIFIILTYFVEESRFNAVMISAWILIAAANIIRAIEKLKD